jgi:hypothetical protein
MRDERSSFKGLLIIDDNTVASLRSLLHSQLRWILFKPPFGSHGAIQPRPERQPPWFLLAQCHERIQISLESAAQCLDAVVLG